MFGELGRILHDELIGQPEVNDTLGRDDDVAVSGSTGEECASASA